MADPRPRGEHAGADYNRAPLIVDSLALPPVPHPPRALQVEVLGRPTSAVDFIYGGYMVARGLQDTLDLVGRPFASFSSVLDFGCGCGRVLRWFQDQAPRVRLHGSDVSAAAIAWDRAHMPFARFEVNAKDPPLAYPDGAFDLVIAVSVVTHLSEEMQLAWLGELHRVLAPGGVALMSVHGDDVSLQRLKGRDRERFLEKGHHYKKVSWWWWRGLHGLPGFYQDAYHSRAYVEREWSRLFAIRAYVRHGPFYTQDLVVLEKAAPSPGRAPDTVVDLPLCSIGGPRPGDRVAGDVLPIFGSSFYPAGGPADVEVRVDGRPLGALRPGIASPRVARAFPAWPTAGAAIFEGRLPLGALEPGPHELSLHALAEPRVAAASAFFATP